MKKLVSDMPDNQLPYDGAHTHKNLFDYCVKTSPKGKDELQSNDLQGVDKARLREVTTTYTH